jgi:hypothetical protein
MDRLRISREKLRKLIHSGELDAFKISGRPTSDLRVTEEASLSAMPSPLTGSGPRKPSAALA